MNYLSKYFSLNLRNKVTETNPTKNAWNCLSEDSTSWVMSKSIRPIVKSAISDVPTNSTRVNLLNNAFIFFIDLIITQKNDSNKENYAK